MGEGEGEWQYSCLFPRVVFGLKRQLRGPVAVGIIADLTMLCFLKEPFARAAHFVIYLLLYKCKSKSRAKRERELTRVQTLALSCALGDSHRLSCALIEIEPAQIFLDSRREFSLVRSGLMRVDGRENSRATLGDSRSGLARTKICKFNLYKGETENYPLPKRNFLNQKLNAPFFPYPDCRLHLYC